VNNPKTTTRNQFHLIQKSPNDASELVSNGSDRGTAMNTLVLKQTQKQVQDEKSPEGAGVSPRLFLSDKLFAAMLGVERLRTERSKRQFILMLIQGKQWLSFDTNRDTFKQIVAAVSSSTRETDIMGWYKRNATIGVLLTEFGQCDINSALNIVHSKVCSALHGRLPLRQSNDLHISFHIYPEGEVIAARAWEADSKLYPDLPGVNMHGKLSLLLKRFMDIVGSIVAITLLLPLLAFIAIAVKLSSEGPVLFCQKRVGQYGSLFTFYKFRSMYFRSESSVHESYAKQFISGQAKSETSSGLYKMSNDRRVTPLGRVLRRLSFDELPQLFNVLKGDMSLVGPRPPIPYELEVYSPWHRRRLLEAKPGITGLWQVTGRSKTVFNDMVRLDLQYAANRTLWLDIAILAKTVWVVLSGEGAY
jgi:lipopolysaccharide/colanic/teichoic acid biosynthesis glycosyltransferase